MVEQLDYFFESADLTFGGVRKVNVVGKTAEVVIIIVGEILTVICF